MRKKNTLVNVRSTILKSLPVVIVLLMTGFIACKKERFSAKEELQNMDQSFSISVGCEQDKQASIRAIAKLIVEKAETDFKFRLFVYSLCYDQLYGDYYIRIADIAEKGLAEGYFSNSEADFLWENRAKFMCEDTGEPILFIPFLEEVDEEQFKKEDLPKDAPIVVFQDEYNENAATSIGWRLVNGSFQAVYEQIDEEFAWANDVWVFGEEEKVSEGNDVKAPGDTATVFNDQLPEEVERVRLPNRDEWGGFIQVTNMSIEPWIRGKFEFKYFVNSSSGTALKDRPFGKWRRKNFKNQRWVNFGDYIGIWNQSNWGPMHLERWIEENSGNPQTITQTINPGSGFPTTTIQTQIQSKDNNLGAANVQFTDLALPAPGVTTYTLNGLNFRRMTGD